MPELTGREKKRASVAWGGLFAVKGAGNGEQFTQTLSGRSSAVVLHQHDECSGYPCGKAVCLGCVSVFGAACPNPTKFLAVTVWLAAPFGV